MPRVSIVIPAYYSHDTIEQTLLAFREQTYRDFEVVIVNSSPETITQGLITRKFPEVNFEQSPTRLFPHAARNRAIARSGGELLVMTDPDCRAQPDWLEKLVAAHDAGHPVVGGGMGLATRRWFERGAHLVKFSWLLPGLPAGFRWIVPSANALYPRSLLEKLGRLDDLLFCGDAVLAWRAGDAGARPWFEPSAVVEHRHEGNLIAFTRMRFRRGIEFGHARIAFEGRTRGRAAIEALLMPLRAIITLVRAGKDSVRAGWGTIFVFTLPVQILGQFGWCLGEALAQVQTVFRGRRDPSRRGVSP